MSIIKYHEYHPIKPLTPGEIRHLRESLDWSQAKMARFLSKDTATISRWESGQHEPDPMTLGVFHGLWKEVFDPDTKNQSATSAAMPTPQKSSDTLSVIAKALLIGGVAYFIAKGLQIKEDD